MIDLHYSFINVGQLRRTCMLVVFLEVWSLTMCNIYRTTNLADHQIFYKSHAIRMRLG